MNIINANINTMVSRPIKNGYLTIQEGKITDLGEMSNYHKQDDLDSIIDLRGADIFPGFIDAHTHLGMWGDSIGFESADGNEDTDPIFPNLRCIDAINPMDRCFSEGLKAGITTVITGPGSANPIAGELAAIKLAGNRIDDMIIKSPVAMKMALGENPKAVYNDKSQTPITRMATAALIREELSKAKRYLKDIEYAKRNDDELPEYDSKLEALLPVIKGELPVHFHAHRADDIFTAIRISKEFNLDYVIVHATEANLILDSLKAENARLLIGPFLTDRNKPELKNMSTTTIGKVSKAGILNAIITDHPETPIQYLLVCVAIAVRDGMSRNEAFKSITINPAKICGIDNRVGSIEVGKDADFVVFNGDPLSIFTNPSMVIVNGNVEYTD